jgi:hypothetical protein
MQWSPEIVARCVHICTMLEQKLHRADSPFVLSVDCNVQHSPFPRVPNVNSSTELEQELRHRDMISAQRRNYRKSVRTTDGIYMLGVLDGDVPN